MVRASARKRLWLGAAAVALFIATVWTSHAMVALEGAHSRGFGLDFIAFYTAGDFVRHGRTHQLYDLGAVVPYQRALAARAGIELGRAYGPYWNPPFYALLFVPFSMLPYWGALAAWLLLAVACAGLSCRLMCRMLPAKTAWQSWALVPVLLGLSAPFIFAVSHAQNTCTSLLLLTLTVTLWRSAGANDWAARRRTFLAGLVGGLLFYKPQLAAAVAAVLVIDLGWRALAGYAVTGCTLLLLNLTLLPGTLVDYRHRLPANLHYIQTQTAYLWEQHVTFKAFWRLLLQGRSVGDTTWPVTLLSAACVLAIGAVLLRAAVRLRNDSAAGDADDIRIRRDRLIAATVAATPLLMPFYFDYDLTLLAVPAVLCAAEFIGRGPEAFAGRDRWLLAALPALYAWVMVGTDLAEKTHLNLTVIMLSGIVSLSIARASRRSSAGRAAEPTQASLLPRAA